MIFKYEKKALDWLNSHILHVVFLAATFVSIIIRYFLKDVPTTDALNCLLPWYEAIKNNGGIFGLGTPVEGLNYNFPYQFVIAIMTYLPIQPLYAYKIFSCLFDYLLAFAVGYIIYSTSTKHKIEHALLAYIIVTCSPVVFMDSATWAQCDSIYVFWIFIAIIMLSKDKYIPAFLFYGVSFAFKFQAIFVLPFFLFYYFYKKKFSIIHFFLIPVSMIILSLPSLLQGRTINEMIHIYTDNTYLHQSIANGYPTFWRLLADGTDYTGADAYGVLKYPAMAFTVLILGCYVYLWVKSKITLSFSNTILIAFVMTYSTVFFLPAMHERYGYSYEILAIIIAFYNLKTIPLAIGLSCLSLTTYGVYLFHNTTNEWFLSVINLVLYVSYMIILNKELIGIEKAEV